MRRSMLALMLWGVAVAAPPQEWTEVPLEPEAATADGQGTDDEVVVWGTAANRAARSAVIRKFAEQGWTQRKRLDDGSVVLRGPAGWMGSAKVGPYGLVTFRRRLVSFSPVTEIATTPTDGMEQFEGRRRADAGVGTQGGIRGPVAKRKIDAVRAKLLVKVEPSIIEYRRTLAETALRQSVAVLPERLDALWLTGQPFSAGPALATPVERRAAILEYWATRPQTREGRIAAGVIEEWIGQVMQASPTPATQAELETAAKRRGDGRYPAPR